MKKYIIILMMFFSTSLSFAQDNYDSVIIELTKNEDYKKIINEYSTKKFDFSDESLYLIGQAFYMLEDDNNCIKFMNLSITKNPNNPKPYYTLASTYNYMGKYEEAIINFRKAIELNPSEPEFYSGLGDSYYNLKNNKLALESYLKSTKQTEIIDRPFSMIAQIYSELKNDEKALESYYIAKSKISKESDSYINALFNIGLLESLKENFDKAEPAFLELIELDENDFHTYAKLIQIYYYQKNYEKAKPLKEKLYLAYKNGLLKDNLKDMFCFDQFKWNGKLVQAFERYEESSEDIYNKHLFYLKDEKDEIELRIQTEFSRISFEQGGSKYLLCMNKGNTHYTYNIGFNDDLNYEDLKNNVIKILEDKVKPVASSRPTNR